MMRSHLNRLQINAELEELVVDSFACLDRDQKHALHQVINYDQEPAAVCHDLWSIFTLCYGFKRHFHFVLTSPGCWRKSSSAFAVLAVLCNVTVQQCTVMTMLMFGNRSIGLAYLLIKYGSIVFMK